MQEKMGEDEMEDDRGVVIEVVGAWNLGGMGMLNCMGVRIGILVCVLVLVVLVVFVVVLVWMVLTMWVVVDVLVMVVETVVVQEVLVDVDCVGVVSESSSGGFVVMVVLEDLGLLLWSSWRMVLWCWNEKGDFLGCLNLMLVAGEHVCASRCVSP